MTQIYFVFEQRQRVSKAVISEDLDDSEGHDWVIQCKGCDRDEHHLPDYRLTMIAFHTSAAQIISRARKSVNDALLSIPSSMLRMTRHRSSSFVLDV